MVVVVVVVVILLLLFFFSSKLPVAVAVVAAAVVVVVVAVVVVCCFCNLIFTSRLPDRRYENRIIVPLVTCVNARKVLYSVGQTQK